MKIRVFLIPCFRTSQGKSENGLTRTIRQIHRSNQVMRKVGVDRKKSSLKELRHFFGVLAVENKVLLPQIQDWLGHKDIQNTSISTRMKGIERRSLAVRMWENT